MKKKFKSIIMTPAILLCLGFLLQACQRQMPSENSCNFVMNSSQQRVSWQTDVPVQLMVHDSVPREAWDAIDQAAEAWNASLGRTVIEITQYGVSDPLAKDDHSIIYYLSKWDVNNPREQARTSIYWYGRKIIEADVMVNTQNFQFHVSTADSVERNKVDLYSLMVHEFGHVLGFAHSEYPDSVMVTELSKGQDRRVVTTQDVNFLKCEY